MSTLIEIGGMGAGIGSLTGKGDKQTKTGELLKSSRKPGNMSKEIFLHSPAAAIVRSAAHSP